MEPFIHGLVSLEINNGQMESLDASDVKLFWLAFWWCVNPVYTFWDWTLVLKLSWLISRNPPSLLYFLCWLWEYLNIQCRVGNLFVAERIIKLPKIYYNSMYNKIMSWALNYEEICWAFCRSLSHVLSAHICSHFSHCLFCWGILISLERHYTPCVNNAHLVKFP